MSGPCRDCKFYEIRQIESRKRVSGWLWWTEYEKTVVNIPFCLRFSVNGNYAQDERLGPVLIASLAGTVRGTANCGSTGLFFKPKDSPS